MKYSNIAVKYHNNIAIVTLNRASKYNIMTTQTLNEICDIFSLFLNSPVKAVIIAGSGKAFCAGADISEMLKLDYNTAKIYSKEGHEALEFIENFPKPVIAALNGFVFGGGCELALACDFRIASADVKIGQPEIKLGIICGWGATQRLPKIIGKPKALRLIMSGDIISADEAEKIGLVDKVVSAENLIKEAIKLAENFTSKPFLALMEAKKAVVFGLNNIPAEGKNFEMECFANCFKTEDQKEGMKAFLEKRNAVFKDR
ncbi:MAG: enoyl-CoA hydratase/isomerase family protein [Actinobacteria bacterium]|nr:enoyl-CoA hydratase/isomerase family protein [Actinomycetota bacterium]